MILPKPPARPPTPPKPTWFKWGLILFILVMVFNAVKPDENTGKSPLEFTSEQINTGLPNLENYTGFEALLGSSSRGTDIKQGDGAAPLCGQSVKVRLTARRLDKELGEPREATFNTGNGNAPAELLPHLTSMRVGGIRRIGLQKQQTLDELLNPDASGPDTGSTEMQMVSGEDKATSVILELLEVDPALTSLTTENDTLGFRLMETGSGSGLAATCGMEIKLKVAVYDSSGKRVWMSSDKAPLTITPGTNTQMAGLEQGVLGLRPGGTRTLILPVRWQRTLTNKPVTHPLPSGKEILLVDVERIE